MFVLKEMLPSYHKWRYNSHGVREQIGKDSVGGAGLRRLWLPGEVSLLGGKVITQATSFLCLFWSLGCLILELIHAILNLCHETDHSRYEGWC